MSYQSYGVRDSLLRSLGFESYEAYLNSPLWQSIIERAAVFHGEACAACGGHATEWHHRGYGLAVLLGESLTPLSPLCRRCHHKVEYCSSGRKRTLVQSHSAFVRLTGRERRRVKGLPPEERKSVPGYCRECGCKAKRGFLHCRPHMRGD
jgi:hypothetical protein